MESRHKGNSAEIDQEYTTREWLCVSKEKLQSIKYVINRMKTRTVLQDIVVNTLYSFSRAVFPYRSEDFQRAIDNIDYDDLNQEERIHLSSIMDSQIAILKMQQLMTPQSPQPQHTPTEHQE